MTELTDIWDLTIEETVANGAAWLDAKFPDWKSRINIETLDLIDGNRCICGQVFQEDNSNSLQPYGTGFDYADNNLLGDAAWWLAKEQGVSEAKWTMFTRTVEEADYLGFTPIDGRWGRLQDAWVDYLKMHP